MKIIDYIVLKGPNFYGPNPMINIRLDLEDRVNYTSATINGFTDKLLSYLPTLKKHYCSYGREGGFVLRLKEGTMFGHIVEHVCLELQSIAEMEVNFGKTRESNTKGVFNVVYSYIDEDAGKLSGKVAVELVDYIVDSILHPEKQLPEYDLKKNLELIKQIEAKNYIGPSTKAIVDEANARDIPYIRLNRFNLLQLGQGKHQKKIEATITEKTSIISMDIAKNYEYFSKELEAIGIPTSKARFCYEFEEAIEYLKQENAPVIFKPSETRNGIGVTLNIKTENELKEAFEYASTINNEFIIEKYVKGNTYRILAINGKYFSTARRQPAIVIGNGKNTIEQLVEIENNKAERNIRYSSALSQIKINDASIRLLQQNGLSLQYIPKEGEEIKLHISCRQDLGGYSVDITDSVHIENQRIIERATKITGLDIAGIDIIAPSLREPITENGGAIIGINIAPDFRIHMNPLKGTPRNVAKPVLDMLFPSTQPFTIPIISITGTNGKTTVAKMVSHILTMRGFDVGLVTSDGIYFRDELIVNGNRTKRDDIVSIFKNPDVDISVLETSVECITYEGIGYKRADVGVILNISDEYKDLGWRDLEDIAYVKLLVAEQMEDWGYVILNADDEMIMSMKDNIRSKIIYFTTKPDNPHIRKHLVNRGIVVTYIKGDFYLLIGDEVKTKIVSVYEVPIAYNGKSISGIYNILGTIATVYGVWKTLNSKEQRTISLEDIRIGIKSFSQSFNNNPFRQNRFFIGDSVFLLDSPRNPASFNNYRDFILRTTKGRRIGIFYNPSILSELCWDNSLTSLENLFDKIYIVGSINSSINCSNFKEKMLKLISMKSEDVILIDEKELENNGENILKTLFEKEEKNAICIYSNEKKVIDAIMQLKEEFDPLD